MHRYLAAGMLAAVVLALAGACLAGDTIATKPEKTCQCGDEPTLGEVYKWARWGCILSGLALVGVIWVGWSMQALARNQVQLGKLIKSQPLAEKD